MDTSNVRIAELEERVRFLEDKLERHSNFEQMLRERTDELATANEELAASNEELAAVNDELARANQEIIDKNGQISEMNENLTLILETIPVGIRIVRKEDNLLVYANKASMDIFGCEDFERDVKNRSAFDFMPEMQPNGRRTVDMAAEFFEKDNCTMDFMCFKLNGDEFIARISTCNVLYRNKISSIAVIEDISHKKHIDRAIRAKEKAEEADNLKSAFLANMSHEIRTPLNAIVGLLQFLTADELTTEQRDIIADMDASAKHLLQLIDEILDISRIEAKLMNIKPENVRLNDLMREVYQMFHSIVMSNDNPKVELVLEDDEFIEDCVVYTDGFRLRQVLINLVANAVKFTEKGTISISYRRCCHGYLKFFVRDTGIGLPASQLEVIFERFKQSEAGSARKYGGSGLGLTISKNLVQLMGGDMWVNSTEGKGSEFYFSLPYEG